MNIELLSSAPESAAADALVWPAFEDSRPTVAAALAAELYDSKEFSGKPGESATIHHPAGIAARRLFLAGAGRREKFGPNEMRKLTGSAFRTLKGRGMKSIVLAIDNATPALAAAAVEGAVLADLETDGLKTDKNGGPKIVDRFAVAAQGEGLAEAIDRARIVAESQNFTRELVNLPGNLLNPAILADRAAAMAAEAGLVCDVLDEDRMRQLGMGSLLGVSMGSAAPPKLIVLSYTPAAGSAVHLGLVGKGVTFDSGGLSIKPADGMEKMKYDMAGGAAVIGAMRAIAALKPAIRVTAYIPAVENMTGSRAQRPGDIVTSMSGKTIEVLNTDAEGRLILADAITYAKTQGCTHLVDAATLTGAIAVALGGIHAGLFSSDDALRDKVQAAAAAAGEKMWPMPLDDEYKDYLKSAFADLPNIGGRYGGAITAAYFIKEFASPTPWVHLDIAGVAWLDDAKPHMAKGPSGYGVRTFVQLAANWQ